MSTLSIGALGRGCSCLDVSLLCTDSSIVAVVAGASIPAVQVRVSSIPGVKARERS